ncbi:TetR family transcriptional regulator [Mesobacillus campisalis]|uniref:TetR family transcriptional regulator n=1 Tax=Mesobacillus campisalis TaxID=1408103 RepID=A0A0M2SWU8_9BACI|nr:TetR family transcriptional regulator [Mesobacillus campisalis]KKK38648.1 TetR family transcriptional regulator [Mesobacillus campisalis]
MPKQTFFNLSDKKRKTLIEAAEHEFSRVPLFEASVSNIIKSAGIPRGSFYQYFNDKEDLYFFLLDEKLQESKKRFIFLLNKHEGDLIEAMKELYHHFLIIIPDEEERNFLRNAMLYTTNKVEKSFADMFDAKQDRERFKEISELIDRKRLNVKSDQEIVHIFQIISAIAFHNFIEKTMKKLSDEEAMKEFTIMLEMIKQGIYKQK